MVDATFTDDFKKILAWADENAKLQVWTNADTPEDANAHVISAQRESGFAGRNICSWE